MCMRGRKSSEEEEEEEEGTWLQGPIGTKDITALSVCMHMRRDSRGSNNNNAKIGGERERETAVCVQCKRQ